VVGDDRMLGVPLRPIVDRPHGHALVVAERRAVEALRSRREEQLRRGEVHLRRQVVGRPEPDRGWAARVKGALDRVRDSVERVVPAHAPEWCALGVTRHGEQQALRGLGQRVPAPGVDGQRVGAAARRVIAAVDDAVAVGHHRDVAVLAADPGARDHRRGDPVAQRALRLADALRGLGHRPGVDLVAAADSCSTGTPRYGPSRSWAEPAARPVPGTAPSPPRGSPPRTPLWVRGNSGATALRPRPGTRRRPRACSDPPRARS
jgi:hypothetical protein